MPASSINANNQLIINLKAPINATDATTKKYVDDQDTALSDRVTTNSTDIATLKQKTVSDWAKAIANVDMNSYKILNLGTPTLNSDAATKKYTDDQDTAISNKVTTNTTDITTLKGKSISDWAKATANVDMNTIHKIVNLAVPTADTDAANKKYIDEQLNTLSTRLTVNEGTTLALTVDLTNTVDMLADTINTNITQTTDITALKAKKVSDWATAGADISMGTHRITGLGDPFGAQDAATKAFVDGKDTALGNRITTTETNITALNAKKVSDWATAGANIIMGGFKITGLGDPTAAQDAATQNYVRTRKITDLTLPTAEVNLNSQKIINLGTPVFDTDAATKLYVNQILSAAQGGNWVQTTRLDIPAVLLWDIPATNPNFYDPTATGWITSATNVGNDFIGANAVRAYLLKVPGTGDGSYIFPTAQIYYESSTATRDTFAYSPKFYATFVNVVVANAYNTTFKNRGVATTANNVTDFILTVSASQKVDVGTVQVYITWRKY